MSEWDYSSYWRKNYEGREAVAWGSSKLAGTAVQLMTQMPVTPYVITLGVLAGFALAGIPRALRVHRAKACLVAADLSFITLEELMELVERHPHEFYYGEALPWRQRHGQNAFELQALDIEAFIGKRARRNAEVKGTEWIHGIGMDEQEPWFRPAEQRSIQHLVLGTTRAGKTRWYDLAISQCIGRGEPVIVIDPNGDEGLAVTCERTCQAMGKASLYKYFHRAHPDKSVRSSLTKNYGRATEAASRVAVSMKSEAGDPFRAYAQMSLNTVIQAILICNILPTLVGLRRTVEGDVPRLTIKVVMAFGSMVFGEDEFAWMAESANLSPKVRNIEEKAEVLRKVYYNDIAKVVANTDLEGVLTILEHERSLFSKMIAGVLPILVMLSSGEMGPLLCPHIDDEEPRRFSDLHSVINADQVLYLGLDSLADPMVGSTIGSLAVADLASTAGEIYNDRLPKPVNIFVDEAGEVINDQLMQLLNKGRGAGINLYIATQTIADFMARMGDEGKAMQDLGNANNIIWLRILDTDTQEFVANKMTPTRYIYVMRTQGNSAGQGAVVQGGIVGERLMQEEGERLPTALLGELRDLENLAVLAGGDIRKRRLPNLTGPTAN
ncbi:conjugative transfer system coupling protein TraD [Pseudomonas aeruginosa]|uniref:conjugative transfer system coupling protein TraD n=1 Tax=Pseudomonas aeruginosa TaxID=287 RepID=UPI001E556D1B|nr:conjugative transfer system coupling protein TraD [Pseudomonas aeruginosa]MCC9289606.1 conjugative transfer system coupling protein TraD [Pseudomonas aeruginosa]UVN18854.1 Coupling protein [Pseudomonas aeruginosa]